MSHKSAPILFVLLAIVLAAAGCAPLPAPATAPQPAATVAPAAPTATTVPPVTPTPVDASKPVEYGPYGQVVWNGAPVAGARVKLAKEGTCRDAGNDGVIANTVANNEGEFAFPNVPEVAWDICYAWPAGQGDGVYMIGERKPEMPVKDLKLSLVKPLRLAALDLSAPLEAPVELRWEGLPEVATYRVAVVDMGTSQLAFQQDVTGTGVTVTGGLEPGHGYEIGLHGLNAKGEQIAYYSGEFKAASAAVAPAALPAQQIPATCYREGLLTYVDPDTRICFAYPQGFAFAGAQGPYAAGSQAQAELRGPAIGAGPEPLFARLSLDYQPYTGVDLPQFVDAMIQRDVPADLVSTVKRTQATWAGRGVEILEPWPGQLSSRVVVVDAAPAGFNILYFWPALGDTPSEQLSKEAVQAQKDMDALYEIVSASFATLPPPGVPIDPSAALNLPASCLIIRDPLYVDGEKGYCFAVTPEMTARREADGSVSFYGPALDQSPDPLRATLAVSVGDAAPGATLEKAVESHLASLGGPLEQIKRSQLTVVSEPGVRLDGVPGRPTASEVLLLHAGKLYTLRFAPDASFEKAKDEMGRLIEVVTRSFGFLPPALRVAVR